MTSISFTTLNGLDPHPSNPGFMHLYGKRTHRRQSVRSGRRSMPPVRTRLRRQFVKMPTVASIKKSVGMAPLIAGLAWALFMGGAMLNVK